MIPVVVPPIRQSFSKPKVVNPPPLKQVTALFLLLLNRALLPQSVGPRLQKIGSDLEGFYMHINNFQNFVHKAL